NISFDDDDKVKPALDKKAKEDQTIKIVRVETDTDKVEEAVAFDTETREDSSLLKGKEKVVSEGQEGTIVKKYEVTLENGKEVDRELVDEVVKEESKNRVVAVGTKEPASEPELVTMSDEKSNKDDETSNNDNQPSGGKVLYMTATG